MLNWLFSIPVAAFRLRQSSRQTLLKRACWLTSLTFAIFCQTVQAQYPGTPAPMTAEASDLKPGSVLFYNLFTSSSTDPTTQNTQITLTNTNLTTAVTVRLFFVYDNSTNDSMFVRLAPAQTYSLLAADLVPNQRGYIMAVAVNSASLCPIQFNHLTGQAQIKFASGHAATLSAVAVAALTSSPATCSGVTTTVNFDGVNYNRMPRVLALDNFPSRVDGNDTLIAINRIGGDLTPGGLASTTGTLFGLVYDDAENPFSFSLPSATQILGSLSDAFPRTSPRLSVIIPAGHSGWLKLYNQTNDFALSGAVINYHPATATQANAFSSGWNMGHRTLTAGSSTYTIPLTAPDLILSKTHSGSFTRGLTGTYTLVVTNQGSQMTAGLNTITITDQLPGNLTLDPASGGMGWTCSGFNTANVSCSTNASLGAGASTPPLQLIVQVGMATPNSIINTATVSNPQDGNLTNNSASDPTTILCQTISVNPANSTLPNGAVGTTYNQSFTQSGGFGTTTFSLSAGTLPQGLSLSAAGTLSGTPSVANSFNFTVRAQDANGCSGERQYLLTINVGSNGLQFYPLAAPVRLLDTRAGQVACSQPSAPIAGQTSLAQTGRNFCGIPANAQALTGNVTTVNSGGGFLTLYPSNAVQPTVASVNYAPNEIINNVFTVGLGTDGAFKIFAFNTTDVVVDVTGYYAPPATGGLYFHPLPKPIRLLETRVGQLGCTTPGAPIQGGDAGTLTQQARITCDGVTIPSGALAIVGNATTVSPQGVGFLTLFPGNATRPLAASSNYGLGQIVNGPFSVGLAPNGEFKIFTFATTHLVVDVLGYYSTEATDANGAGLLFTPLAKPVRLLETRAGQPVGCNLPSALLNGQQEYTQGARGTCDGVTIPTNALGVVGNATVVQPNGPGFLTLWPSSAANRPTVATANYSLGEVTNRHFIVGLGGGDGAFKMYSFATSHLVIDLSGYFAP